MEILLLLVFLAIVAAAVVIRRRVNDPANPFGLWFERNMRSRMGQAAKVVAYLTLAAWFLVYLVAPKEERGSFGDLMQGFRKAIGLEGEETPAPPSADPSSAHSSTRAPVRIPDPEETSKQVPGRP